VRETDALAEPARPPASLAMPVRGDAGFVGVAVRRRGTATGASADDARKAGGL
jgi:hypothetical protein